MLTAPFQCRLMIRFSQKMWKESVLVIRVSSRPLVQWVYWLLRFWRERTVFCWFEYFDLIKWEEWNAKLFKCNFIFGFLGIMRKERCSWFSLVLKLKFVHHCRWMGAEPWSSFVLASEACCACLSGELHY